MACLIVPRFRHILHRRPSVPPTETAGYKKYIDDGKCSEYISVTDRT